MCWNHSLMCIRSKYMPAIARLAHDLTTDAWTTSAATHRIAVIVPLVDLIFPDFTQLCRDQGRSLRERAWSFARPFGKQQKRFTALPWQTIPFVPNSSCANFTVSYQLLTPVGQEFFLNASFYMGIWISSDRMSERMAERYAR